MIRHPIEAEGITFKNLLSGPATPGRILNYLRRSGAGRLRHRAGYRATDLAGDVGCAWTTEFMLGLGLVRPGVTADGVTFLLEPTAEGAEVCALLQDTASPFHEGNDPARTRREMARCAAGLAERFRAAFTASWPFRVLGGYLSEHGYTYADRAGFLNGYFDAVKALYGDAAAPRSARTGENRVPSLLQLCAVFEMVEDAGGLLRFDPAAFSGAPARAFVAAEQRMRDRHDLTVREHDVEALAAKYGADGNELREVLLRSSAVQQRFKDDLLAEQRGRCALCGLDVPELLVGSHIRPAARSDLRDKLDLNNGLLLCAAHDKLFDRLLISFDGDGGLLVSAALNDRQRRALGLRPGHTLARALLTERRRALLAEHRAAFEAAERGR